MRQHVRAAGAVSAALLMGLAAGGAEAATQVTSFSVSVTVVASCTVSAGAPAPGPTCQAPARSGAQAATIVAREPVVRIVADPASGSRVRVVEF